jgi:ATP-dependent exoDNAse (exonuclease V) beta subunit
VPGQSGLAATEIGDVVHVLLENGVAGDVEEPVRARYASATDEDIARVAGLVKAWHDSPLARRLSEMEGVRPELPFAFEHDGVLLHGRFDVYAGSGGRALVVDYKTNRLEELTPEVALEDEYAIQRLVYALAALRAGADEVEVVYLFLERPDEPVAQVFARSEVVALEAELSEAIAAIQEGRFLPTPSELACSGCPALDVVCAGPRLLAYGPAA